MDKYCEQCPFENQEHRTSKYLRSAPNETKLNSNDLTRKYPKHRVPRSVSPKFSSVSVYDQPFPHIPHFIILIDSHVKFQSF